MKNTVFILLFLFTSLLGFSQSNPLFSSTVEKEMETLKVSTPPFYASNLQTNYTPVNRTSPHSSTVEYDFDIAFKHKEAPIEVRFNFIPKSTVALEARLERIASEIGISTSAEAQKLMPSEYEFVGCKSAGRIFGRQSKEFTSYEAAACYIYIVDEGLVEISLFYDYPEEGKQEKFNEDISYLINNFRFEKPVNDEGSFAGIGINFKLDKKENKYIITGVLENGPAYRAGVLPGDEIYAVKGTKINKKDMSRVVRELRGQPETTVKIEVVRGVLFYIYDITRSSINITDQLVFKTEEDYQLEELYFNNTVDYLLSGKLSRDYKQDFIKTTELGEQYYFKLPFPKNIKGTITVNNEAAENIVTYTLARGPKADMNQLLTRYEGFLNNKYSGDFLFDIRDEEDEYIIETVTPEWLTEHAVLKIEEQNGESSIVLTIYRPFNLDKKNEDKY